MLFPEAFPAYAVTFAGEELASRLIQGLSLTRRTVFRFNPLRGDPEISKKQLAGDGFELDPVPGLPGANSIDAAAKPALIAHPLWVSGAVYVQNASSMLAALAVDPKAGETVLDLTAAPGSKTQLMSVLMENTGRISAVEVQRDRYYRMIANLEKCGSTSVRCFHKDGTRVGRLKPGAFDRVLLDAPCSSESLFGEPGNAAAPDWSLKKVKSTVQKQKMLVNAAMAATRPGGRLIYATCTINPLENEEMDAYILERLGDRMEPEPLDPAWNGQCPVYSLPGYPDSAHRLRIMPGPVWDAFFIACYRKKE